MSYDTRIHVTLENHSILGMKSLTRIRNIIIL